jgi:hypothetical protein
MTDDAAKTDNSTPISTRAEARAKRRKREAAKMAFREACFEALTEGLTHELIAERCGVSVATVRREIDRAIDARQIRPPERHVHVQIARATKALQMLNVQITEGAIAAVTPYLRTLAALDRYHGLAGLLAPVERRRHAPPPLPAPPLALTHAAPPLDAATVAESSNDS